MQNKYFLIILPLLCFCVFITLYTNYKITFYNNITGHLDYFDVADDEPDSIDVVFSFAGYIPVREKKAYSLFNVHKNSIWVMSYGSPMSDLEKILGQKFDTARIFQIKSARNTFEEILDLRHFLNDSRGKKILPPNKKKTSIALVSNSFHLKRIQMISRTLLSGYDISLIPAENDTTDVPEIQFYRDEYHDMFFDWWRCFIWKISFGTIAVMAKRNKYGHVSNIEILTARE